MEKKIAYVGIDYHVNFLSIAITVESENDFYQTIRLANRDKTVFKHMKKLSNVVVALRDIDLGESLPKEAQ